MLICAILINKYYHYYVSNTPTGSGSTIAFETNPFSPIHTLVRSTNLCVLTVHIKLITIEYVTCFFPDSLKVFITTSVIYTWTLRWLLHPEGATPICGLDRYVPPDRVGLSGSPSLNRVSFLPLMVLCSRYAP